MGACNSTPKNKGIAEVKTIKMKEIGFDENLNEVFQDSESVLNNIAETNNGIAEAHNKLVEAVDARVKEAKDTETEALLKKEYQQYVVTALTWLKEDGCTPSVAADGTITLEGDGSEEKKLVREAVEALIEGLKTCTLSLPELTKDVAGLAGKVTEIDMSEVQSNIKDKASNPMQIAKDLKSLKDNMSAVSKGPKICDQMKTTTTELVGKFRGN